MGLFKPSPSRLCAKGKRAFERQEYEKALGLFKEASDGECGEASFLLGGMYANGQGVEMDKNAAFVLYLKAGRERYSYSYYYIGKAYEDCWSKTETKSIGRYVFAIDWYKRSVAAKAPNWHEASEALKNARAIMKESRERKPKPPEERPKTAEVTPDEFLGMVFGGKPAPKGARVFSPKPEKPPEVSTPKPVRQPKPLETLNKDRVIIDMKLMMGQTKLSEDEIDSAHQIADIMAAAGDHGEALKYYELCFMNGDKGVCGALGDIYYNGRGTEKDVTEAVHFFIEDAKTGSVPSMLMAGGMFYRGEGAEKSMKFAALMYTSALKAGGEDTRRQIMDEAAKGNEAAKIALEINKKGEENNG